MIQPHNRAATHYSTPMEPKIVVHDDPIRIKIVEDIDLREERVFKKHQGREPTDVLR